MCHIVCEQTDTTADNVPCLSSSSVHSKEVENVSQGQEVLDHGTSPTFYSNSISDMTWDQKHNFSVLNAIDVLHGKQINWTSAENKPYIALVNKLWGKLDQIVCSSLMGTPFFYRSHIPNSKQSNTKYARSLEVKNQSVENTMRKWRGRRGVWPLHVQEKLPKKTFTHKLKVFPERETGNFFGICTLAVPLIWIQWR